MLMPRDKEILKFIEKHKALSIYQTYRIFFNNAKYGYDRARKRLKELEEMELLLSYKNKATDEKIYYIKDKVSAHDLYINDFYSVLVFNGCKNIEFIKEPRYLNGLIRPDAYFKFEFNDNLYFILLEVDLNHYTELSKFQMYEKLYKEQTLQQQCYGTFPLIVVVTEDNTLRYESESFDIINLDFKLSRFSNKVLGLA